MSTNPNNKRIAINTIIIYLRMFLSALIGFFTTRYVLEALGVSDYGLFNVVGGVISMLNFLSVGMHTTTRRYVNVEMGKKDGEVNKVFNVCLVLHIGFALLIYLVAISIGLWYINNMLNAPHEKMSDARFVFFISTTVSAIGIINVPYQALMSAYEKFLQMAIIDIFSNFLKIPLVIALVFYTGNKLLFYASGLCMMTIFSFGAYFLYCFYKMHDLVEWNFFRRTSLYKEILVFNNYTSLGAFAYLARSQGSTMVVNYFFGTLVNGAFAIASQIENQLQNLVGNLCLAATPQMTQSYSAGNFQRSFDIVCRITRFSALLMIVVSFSIFVSLEPLLEIWLNKIPEGSLILCQAILLSLFIRSLSMGVDSLIQATGKVKEYQIIQSTLLVLGIPLSVLFSILGLPPVFVLYAFIICDIIRAISMFVIICRITPFDLKKYSILAYIPLVKVLLLLLIYYAFFRCLRLDTLPLQLFGFVTTIIVSSLLCLILGMTEHERKETVGKVLKKLYLIIGIFFQKIKIIRQS